jgi:hypothetical protein
MSYHRLIPSDFAVRYSSLHGSKGVILRLARQTGSIYYQFPFKSLAILIFISPQNELRHILPFSPTLPLVPLKTLL